MFKNIKLSTIVFFIFILFILLDIFGYIAIKQQITLNHFKENTILFANIKNSSSDLLSKVLYQFSKQKEILKEKHTIALDFVAKNGVDANLSSLYQTLNSEKSNNPYNIYITDDNYTIKNTTFTPDIGFNLSFAKELFDNHKKRNIIGVSAPIFETYSFKFNSYSDSYLPSPNEKKVLQVSYTYGGGIENDLENIQAILDKNSYIKDVKAYILFSDGYVGDFLFKSFKPYKQTLEDVIQRMEKGKVVLKNIKINEIVHANLTIDGDADRYKAIYIAQQSPIFEDAKIIYEVVFDEKEYLEKIDTLNIVMGLVTIFGLLAILFLYKIRFKEFLFLQNKTFMQHSIHEIKTPLSIINLNHQLRVKKYGKDEFSEDIESAIKVLKNSYEDMSFAIVDKKFIYDVKQINLHNFVTSRVDYFETIGKSYNKNIIYHGESICEVIISEIELMRLIDNNLSNALKYSQNNSAIEVILEKNILSFSSIGNPISDSKKIFESYERENETRGGLGLGLHIVKNIAQKYDIVISVKREQDRNLFSYNFKCEAEGR